ncbi:MAG: hypothetical protein IJZ37_03600 [Clostridia bacterium]|nr:hypothetical protein [Clostridia bacterium]MBQ8399411.1 hypothetical protein [Clostridia bacterium]
MKKDQTTQLYQEIYKNALMGLGTTTHLLKGNRGRDLSDSLRCQSAEYLSVCRNVQNRMKERGGKPKGLSRMEKIRTDGMVSLNLMMNDSDSHVAQMLMTGSTMGMINAEKKLKKFPNADPYAKALMKHLSDYERDTLEKMKGFL